MSTLRADKDNPRFINLTIFPANKGLLSSVPPTVIEHEYLTESNNLIHTTHGSRRTRPGLAEYYQEGFGTGGEMRGVFDFWRTTSGTKTHKVVAVTDGKVFADSADGIFTDIWTPAAAFNTEAFISMDSLINLLVIGVQGRAPIKYNQTGQATDLGGSPPNAWMVRRHRGSLYLAGDPSNPEVLTKSGHEDPEDYVGATSDSFNIDLGAPDPYGITALSPSLYGRMYVGKWNSIWELQTDTIGQFILPVTESIGMVSHNATKSTGNDLIFPSIRGVHSLKATQNFGDTESNFISFPVHDIWTDLVDFNNSQKMCAAFIPEYNSYLITFPRRGSENYDLLGFNLVTQDIFYWEGFNASFITTFQDTEKRTRLMVGTTDANIGIGKTTDTTDFKDFLASFGSSFKTGNIFPTYQPKAVWQFKNLTLFYKPQGTEPIRVTYKVDNQKIETLEYAQEGTSGTPLGSFILGTSILGSVAGSYTQATKEIKGYGNSIQLEVAMEPESATEPSGMEVYGYEIGCEQVGDATIPVATN